MAARGRDRRRGGREGGGGRGGGGGGDRAAQGTLGPAAEAPVGPEVLGYDRITIDMSAEGVLGRGANGEVRKGTVDGKPAVFKVRIVMIISLM